MWDGLLRELDAWGDAGRTATVWWRDDDATVPTPALDRLLTVSQRYEAPLALAVIPARAEPALADRLRSETQTAVLQHGWAHANHAAIGAAKAELGPERPIAFQLGELARGWLVLVRLFGERAASVLVPPHNRIAPALAAALPEAGYRGLSTYGPRARPGPDLAQVNAHADIMNWRTRAFAGEEPSLRLVATHLRAKRIGDADPDEPTGLLTHHLAHDDDAWRFVESFLAMVRSHAAARLVDARPLFRGR